MTDRISKVTAGARRVFIKATTRAEGLAIIARGVCPGCEGKWSAAHKKCVPGLFPKAGGGE